MHTVVPGWFGASSIWLIPLIWRLVRSALPGGTGLRGPGTIRLWLGFLGVLVASCTLEATLIHINGFNALGQALALALGKHVGHVATPLSMIALFLVSLPWLFDSHWRNMLALADVSLGLGLNIRARRDDSEVPRGERRSRRQAGSDAASAHGASGLFPLDSPATLDGSRPRRPTPWYPPATGKRTTGSTSATGAAAARGEVAREAREAREVREVRETATWRVEPRLSDTADIAPDSGLSEPAAPAGWLHETPAAAVLAATGPAAAINARAPMASVVPPLKQTPGGSTPWRAEPVRPPVSGAHANASPASAASGIAHGVRGAAATPPLDGIKPPFASPLPTRRNVAQPVAGNTAARVAASVTPPRPPRTPRPPRPFVWPTKSALAAMQTQSVSKPMATTPAARPVAPRPAAPFDAQPSVPLSGNVLETLRSIDENTARWTTLAGASLARSTDADGRAQATAAHREHVAEPRLPDATQDSAAQAAVTANDAADVHKTVGLLAATPTEVWQPEQHVAAAADGEMNASPAFGVWQTRSATATFAAHPGSLTAVDPPQPAQPAQPAVSHDAAPLAASTPNDLHNAHEAHEAVIEHDPASLSYAALPAAAAFVAAPNADAQPQTPPAHTATPDASPYGTSWHQSASSSAAQDDAADPFAVAQSPQPAWPATEHGLAPWTLMDDEPAGDAAAAASVPAPADDHAAFAPRLADMPTPAAPGTAHAHAQATPVASETIDAEEPALPASETAAAGSNIVRFPRIAHDAQRMMTEAVAASESDLGQQIESTGTANVPAWHAAASFDWQATQPAQANALVEVVADAPPSMDVAAIAPVPMPPVLMPLSMDLAPAPWEIPLPNTTDALTAPDAPDALKAPATPDTPDATYAAPATAEAAPEAASRQPVRGHAPTTFAFQPLAASTVELPGLDLLESPSTDIDPVPEAALAETGQLIEQRLQEFKVPVTVVGASAGPVITRFEVEPALGVRGSQIVGLMKDLSRGLGLTSIRVVETIPGKTCMGLELPNARRQMIRLSEIFESAPWLRSTSKLTLAMGKDIVGLPVVTDLAKAPHMLVAGTTGSGKSVAINAMILSLLYKATPEDVRLIMIDPKMLELSVYEGIPHLLAPVVTDMKLAANALNWCVGEMEKRYRLMSAVGVRNLAGFNQKIRDAAAHEKKIGNPFSLTPEAPEPLAPLPMIVVVIDELADLMMVAGKKIEELIARLAQKARAAGIHLILATQRPSVDVITGLIKANIPTRVAFQVSSKIDSRTILDQMGAESLLGQGDMLFLPPGTGYPQRVHGAFVADEEVHAVVEYLKQFGEPEYVEGILDGPASDGAAQDLFGDAPDAEADPLYDEAVAFVVRTRRASISSVQRQLRIGYNRAARLVEQMEAAGLVSPMGINGSREVLAPGQPE